jgi:hypothetical protein
MTKEGKMSEIIVYTMKNSSNCVKLKEALKTKDIEFEERDIETKETIIDIQCLGCFPNEAAVLWIGRNC